MRTLAEIGDVCMDTSHRYFFFLNTVSLMLSKQRFSAAHAANWLREIERLKLSGQWETLLARYVSREEAAEMARVGLRQAAARPAGQ